MSAQPKWVGVPHPKCELVGRAIKVVRSASEDPMTPDEDLILSQYERIKELEGQLRASEVCAVYEPPKPVCDHNYIYRGHGHNYSVFVCTKCQAEEER